MSKNSNENGRAYEYACLKALHEYISKYRAAEIVEEEGYEAAKSAWNAKSEVEQKLYSLSAESTLETISALEPRITEPDNDTLRLHIQKDTKGQDGDVRDIIIERKDIVWEIGLGIKHNHQAVKHSRIGQKLDFGSKWYGSECSEEYWTAVSPIFKYLEEEKNKGTAFRELPDKEDKVYVPLLEAFLKEVKTQIDRDSSIPEKLVGYLLSKYDFYKVVSEDERRVTVIQSFNMYGTLNLPTKNKEAKIKVSKIELPGRLLYAGFKPDSKTTVLICFDNGWQFSFRIHNAKDTVETSLKFDVQIVGMPTDVNIKFNCKW